MHLELSKCYSFKGYLKESNQIVTLKCNYYFVLMLILGGTSKNMQY